MIVFSRSLGLLVLLLLLLVGSGAWPAAGEQPPSAMDASDFGLAFINSVEAPRSPARLQRGVDAGARMDRLPLYWNGVEPQRGAWQWGRVDAALRANEAAGLDTLMVLLGTAEPYYPGSVPPVTTQEALGGGVIEAAQPDALADQQRCHDGVRPPTGLDEPIWADGSDLPGAGKGINPANPWARFVQEAATRYHPGGAAGTTVRYWEIWNEPDLCQFWSGTPRQYARLLKVAYLVIKQVDPQAMVLWGGLAHHEQPDFLPALVHTLYQDPLAPRFDGFFDAAASHHYSDVTKGEGYTRRIRDALAGTGWENKAVWITESGVPVCGDEIGPACPNPHRADAAGQAAYIWQNIAYTRLAGGGPIFHFQLHDDCGNDHKPAPPADAFGLVTNEGDAQCVPHRTLPRGAYRAYQLAAEYFPGTELLWEEEEGGVRRVAFFHPASGERRTLLWATGAAGASAQLAATGYDARQLLPDGSYRDVEPAAGAYEIALAGSTNPRLSGSATYIGGTPVLVIERDALPPELALEVVPLEEGLVELAWRASDEGSGIAEQGVAVWIALNDGPWQPWLEEVEAAGSTLFEGEAGATYRFALLASDRAGNAHSEPRVLGEITIGDAAPPPIEEEPAPAAPALFIPFVRN